MKRSWSQARLSCFPLRRYNGSGAGQRANQAIMKWLRGVGMIVSVFVGAILGVVLAAFAVYFAILYALGLPLKEWRFY